MNKDEIDKIKIDAHELLLQLRNVFITFVREHEGTSQQLQISCHIALVWLTSAHVSSASKTKKRAYAMIERFALDIKKEIENDFKEVH